MEERMSHHEAKDGHCCPCQCKGLNFFFFLLKKCHNGAQFFPFRRGKNRKRLLPCGAGVQRNVKMHVFGLLGYPLLFCRGEEESWHTDAVMRADFLWCFQTDTAAWTH